MRAIDEREAGIRNKADMRRAEPLPTSPSGVSHPGDTEVTESKASRPQSFSIGGAFGSAAQWTAQQCGHASTFAIACLVIVVWAATGPIFNYSDTWQLIINTGTTIVTFLMVFLIQNTQNRDSAEMHLKLDELIRVSESARNRLLDLKDLSEDELKRLKRNFEQLAAGSEDDTLLQKAADDLTAARSEIKAAQEKVISVAGGRS